MKTNKVCRICDVELDDENWYPSYLKNGNYICKECVKEYDSLHREANRDKINAQKRLHYEANQNKLTEQKRLYREAHRDELNARALLHLEANRDEINARARARHKANPEKGKARSTRASRKRGHLPMSKNKECSLWLGVHIGEPVLVGLFKNVERMPMNNPGYDLICGNGKKIDVKISCARKKGGWAFSIKHNTTADYFLCMAFDTRKDLNPLYIWLLPGNVFNHFVLASISPSTIDKWSEYELPIDKAILYCDSMKARATKDELPISLYTMTDNIHTVQGDETK